jgi:MFS family permease
MLSLPRTCVVAALCVDRLAYPNGVILMIKSTFYVQVTMTTQRKSSRELSMPNSVDTVGSAVDGWRDTDSRCRMNVWLCYANLAIYSMCFWIQVNVLPFLIKEYGGGMKEFATVSTAFSVIQTVGSLYFGRIADKYGFKIALYIATVASAISYFCLGQATSLPLIVASKIPCVAQHAYQGSQVVIACSTSKASRPTAMARLNIAYGFGMIVGPKVGGIVQEAMKEHATANVAGVCSVLSLLLILLMSSPSRSDIELPPMKSQSDDPSVQPRSQMSFASMLHLPGVALLLTIKTAATLPGKLVHRATIFLVQLLIFCRCFAPEHNAYAAAAHGCQCCWIHYQHWRDHWRFCQFCFGPVR